MKRSAPIGSVDWLVEFRRGTFDNRPPVHVDPKEKKRPIKFVPVFGGPPGGYVQKAPKKKTDVQGDYAVVDGLAALGFCSIRTAILLLAIFGTLVIPTLTANAAKIAGYGINAVGEPHDPMFPKNIVVFEIPKKIERRNFFDFRIATDPFKHCLCVRTRDGVPISCIPMIERYVANGPFGLGVIWGHFWKLIQKFQVGGIFGKNCWGSADILDFEIQRQHVVIILQRRLADVEVGQFERENSVRRVGGNLIGTPQAAILNNSSQHKAASEESDYDVGERRGVHIYYVLILILAFFCGMLVTLAAYWWVGWLR